MNILSSSAQEIKGKLFMLWSWSTSRMFQKCQRQWYFKTEVASHASKDENRREAYLLSKLQSLSAWRGSLVDQIISNRVILGLKYQQELNLSETIHYAQTLFEEQWQSAISHRLRDPHFSSVSAEDNFAAFHAVEYGEGIKPKDREQAWGEVEQALTNFSKMTELLNKLKSASQLIPQRPLVYSLSEVKVRAVPDLIAFFNNQPPLIVDWKVNVFGTNDNRQQLGTYALALSRCEPHKDFPSSIRNYTPIDIHLLEVQLLTNLQRPYILTETDVVEIDAFIYQSARQMQLALGNEEDGSFHPFEYPVTDDPTLCERCNYRSLCWKERESWAEWKQTSLL